MRACRQVEVDELDHDTVLRCWQSGEATLHMYMEKGMRGTDPGEWWYVQDKKKSLLEGASKARHVRALSTG